MTLEFAKDQIFLVIVGAWQASVFSKPFIHQEIFEGRTSIIDDLGNVPIPNVSNAFGEEKYRIQIQNDRLCTVAFEHTDTCYVQSIDTLQKILSLLPYTPVGALGINFTVLVDDIPNSAWLNFESKSRSITDLGYTIQNAVTQLSVTKDTYAINFVVSKQQKLLIQANVDYQIPDVSFIRQHLCLDLVKKHSVEVTTFLTSLLG